MWQVCVFLVFFFKQKTAYEMRISDWSSDVCSSDLDPCDDRARDEGIDRQHRIRRWRGRRADARRKCRREACGGRADPRGGGRLWQARSEEHTSELQSLMRISYAVFCLKKTNKNNNRTCTRKEGRHKPTRIIGRQRQ